MLVNFRSSCGGYFTLIKIATKCANEQTSTSRYRIMPKRFFQAPPPKKRLKTSSSRNKVGEMMVKPNNGSGSASEGHDVLGTADADARRVQDDGNSKIHRVAQDFSNVKLEYLQPPVKSANDKKEYRVVKLPNGLTALLIADPSPVSSQVDSMEDEEDEDQDESGSKDDEESGSDESGESEDEDEDSVDKNDNEDGENAGTERTKREEKMAACGLCIGVGSFSDPPEIPGMAHFLEHMVFMGSEKYPQENDFDAFIKKHGGSDNAYTECERTTFYFEIHEKYLDSALDRFAQFFTNPLMKRDAIAREREAVESEFQMALPSDFHRKEQLFSSLAKTGHPATKFVWGNLATLRDNVTDEKLYEELHKFRKRHYSAHRMTVAIQARLSLDTLESYVVERFSNVPNNGLPGTDFNEYKDAVSFDTPTFRRMYKIKPVKDVCQVELTWTMPSLHHLYKSKPHQYVSWIIGHEGKGSLVSYLRKKMWCLDIFSGNGESGFEHSSMYALFSLCLVLTDEGHKNLKQVLDAVYSYVNLLRREGPQKRIYDEIHQIEETNFRFAEETPPDEYVEDLCENMHYYEPAHYINGSDLYMEYDPSSIERCMDALRPERANIMIFDNKFNEEEFDKIEPWFKTRYTVVDIPNEWIEHWKSIGPFLEFHLPEPNVFIADDFSLVAKPDETPEYPSKVYSDPISEVWYKPDAKFRLPECCVNFFYISPLPLASPENSAMLDLFVTMLKMLLVEDLYPATAAELSLDVLSAETGLVVKVNGFNEKLPLLLTIVTERIANFSSLVTRDFFQVMKGEQLKTYYNTLLKPGKLVKDVRLSILSHVHWSAVDKHAAMSGVRFEQMQMFAKHLTDHVYAKCLVQGNMSEADAIANVKRCIGILNCGALLPNTAPCRRVMEMPLGVRCCRVKNFNAADVNSNVTNYYQSGGTSVRRAVLIQLVIMMMEEPLFNQLRTQEQLGYNVFCLLRDTFGVVGYSISVCVQADKYTTEHVDGRIEHFLKSMIRRLEETSEEELASVKRALTRVKRCTDIHLKEEVDRNWSEIISSEYAFDRVAREIDAIQLVNVQHLREWMTSHTLGGSNFRKLTVQVVGRDGSDEANPDRRPRPAGVASPENHTDGETRRKIHHSLTYLRDLPNEMTKKPADYYITSIEEYKRDLRVFPVYERPPPDVVTTPEPF